jgi:hypothetical protein
MEALFILEYALNNESIFYTVEQRQRIQRSLKKRFFIHFKTESYFSFSLELKKSLKKKLTELTLIGKCSFSDQYIYMYY